MKKIVLELFFSIWTCFWALKHSYKWIRVENKISWFYLLTLFCMTFFWENEKFWKNFTKMAITPQIMVSNMQMRGVLGSWDPRLHIWVFKSRAGGPWRGLRPSTPRGEVFGVAGSLRDLNRSPCDFAARRWQPEFCLVCFLPVLCTANDILICFAYLWQFKFNAIFKFFEQKFVH